MIIKLEIATVPATKAAVAIATTIAISLIATNCEVKDIGVASIVTLAVTALATIRLIGQ